MKRLVFLFLAILLVGVLTGCSVTSKSGCITLMNYSDQTVTVKIGSHTLFALKGGSSTVYFYREMEAASISVTGVELEAPDENMHQNPTAAELKFGYKYMLLLLQQEGKYNLYVDPSWVGDQDDAPSEGPNQEY